jgi:hypothetical protein
MKGETPHVSKKTFCASGIAGDELAAALVRIVGAPT